MLARTRSRHRRLELAAGSAALVSGLAAAAPALVHPASSWAMAGAVLAGVAGVAFAAGGAAGLVRALVRPPSEADSAAWVEAAFCELRECLVTALEGGEFAPACARRAVRTLEGREAELARVEPRSAARARAIVVGGALASLCAALASILAAPHGGAPVRPPQAETPAQAAPAETPPTRSPEPRKALGVEVIAAGARGQARREVTLGADAAAILLWTPAGYERAVELFVSGTGGEAGRR